MRKIFLLILMLPMICGCCACRKGSPVIGNLENAVWILTELTEKPVTSNVSVSFDAHSKVMNGTSGCYSIYAGYHLFEKETGNIEFLNPGFKHDNCPVNAEIEKLAGLLSSVVTVKIDGGHLLMIDNSQNIVAIFKQ